VPSARSTARSAATRLLPERLARYKSLIDAGSLTVTIPPFGEYADWAA
jgi:hypothetical protein